MRYVIYRFFKLYIFGFYTVVVLIIYFRCIIYDGMKRIEATLNDVNLVNSVIHKATKWLKRYIMNITLN
jgi:hypothetical protein